jgi:hypothetical protein
MVIMGHKAIISGEKILNNGCYVSFKTAFTA